MSTHQDNGQEDLKGAGIPFRIHETTLSDKIDNWMPADAMKSRPISSVPHWKEWGIAERLCEAKGENRRHVLKSI